MLKRKLYLRGMSASILFVLSIFLASCGSSDEGNTSPVAPGPGGTPTSTLSQTGTNSPCWQQGYWYYQWNGYGYEPQHCLIGYNVWVTGFQLYNTHIAISPFDYVAVIGYVPAGYSYLNVYQPSYTFFDYVMFGSEAWSANWNSSWASWSYYGFSNSFSYQSYQTSSPNIYSNWNSSVGIRIYVQGSQVSILNGNQYFWQNSSSVNGSLSVQWYGGHQNDAYLLQIVHCEDRNGNAIACPISF